MPTLWELFIVFAEVGVMTFGGGYAMLPILQREVVENKHWATEEELTDYFAIGQCTPGIIAVNTATFIGQKRKGVWGGIVATLGMVFPSLVIITLLAGLITSFSHLEWVQNAFAGIRVCVCVLILNATVKLWQGAVKDVWGALIFAAVLAGSLLTDLSPVLFVLAAAVATLGLVTPSVIVILIVASFLKAFRSNKFVDAAFYGLRPASTAMVASAGIGVVLLSLVNTDASGLALFRWKELALAAVILVLTRWVPVTKKLHPIVFIGAAAVVGVVFRF